mmetsp:Transcript_65302/g.142253  ORF Transcript_65302/g.142253 Transcript_65302/m.142253 type:complete len:120 (+) Transcript_65302:1462-1821(+)
MAGLENGSLCPWVCAEIAETSLGVLREAPHRHPTAEERSSKLMKMRNHKLGTRWETTSLKAFESDSGSPYSAQKVRGVKTAHKVGLAPSSLCHTQEGFQLMGLHKAISHDVFGESIEIE